MQNQGEEKIILQEGNSERVISKEEFDNLNANPQVKLKPMSEGVYRKLQRMEG